MSRRDRYYPVRAVRSALRALGMEPASKGNATGHEPWVNEEGKCVKPSLRLRMVPHGHLYSLGLALENRGICSRREFISTVKEAA